uniref:BHLH domain-containing protein n=1 Tax=Kalanchoe fedtschenkoi TaxID=63787 RepID=A0A7N0T4S3_KALFE
MELSQSFLLEELLGLRRENCSTYQTGVAMDEFYTDGWSCDFIDESQVLAASADAGMATAAGFAMPQMEPYFDLPFSEVYNSLDASFTAPVTTVADQFSLAYEINNGTTLLPPIHDQYTSMVDEEFTFLSNGVQHVGEDKYASGCKVEMVLSPGENLGSYKSLGGGKERRNGVKKVGGQPSKNLMAERRRRKRLNDRLSMLRSIVPRISKMDRTSILADTIDYMKELLEKVSKLEEEEKEHTEAGPINKLKELKSSEGQAKNSPKFDVKMGEKDTRIDICCSTRPGLLISTVNTLETLGLEIQQCVISCFNDFSMQAACSQVAEEPMELTTEEIKQALFRNAGYEGRCLKESSQEMS